MPKGRTPGRAASRRAPLAQTVEPADSAAPSRRGPDGPAPSSSLASLQRRAQLLGHRAPPLGPQRKSGAMMTSAAMIRDAPTGTTVFSSTHTYEDVVTAVGDYHDDARTPANDFGRQLVQLETVGAGIARWEGKYGAVTQAIPNRTLGAKTVDKRRRVLLTLKGDVGPESVTVKGEGLTQATLDHQADRAALNQRVQEALASDDVRLHNSAEWVLAGRTSLYAVTPTGDSYARLRQDRKNPARDEAFFPPAGTGSPGHLLDAEATYNANDLANNAGVRLYPLGKAVNGWQDDRAVAVVRPALRPQANVFMTLRHEVQHDADHHKGREGSAGMRRAGEDFAAAGMLVNPATKAVTAGPHANLVAAARAKNAAMAEVQLGIYKTEFRAYSYMEGTAGGTLTNLDDTVQNQAHQNLNFSARQLAIFRHIYAGYPHFKAGWDKNDLLADGVTRFRAAVVAYWRPDTEAFNKDNSIRVEDFYLALDAAGTKRARTGMEHLLGTDAAPVSVQVTDAASAPVLAIIRAAEGLSVPEAEAIDGSPLFQQKLAAHLDGAALAAVQHAVRMATATDAVAHLFD